MRAPLCRYRPSRLIVNVLASALRRFYYHHALCNITRNRNETSKRGFPSLLTNKSPAVRCLGFNRRRNLHIMCSTCMYSALAIARNENGRNATVMNNSPGRLSTNSMQQTRGSQNDHLPLSSANAGPANG